MPKEACPNIKWGSVAWVGQGPEFFISLADHHEWKRSYTVFGFVLPEDMEIAEKISSLPSKLDVWANVTVSVLEEPVSLRVVRVAGYNEL
jgi:cyclophilin family peptidyl-prolyl cis-trans isomerase